MKNPIEPTSLMLFSIAYFSIVVLNLIYIYPDAMYSFFNFLINYHFFEISLFVGLAFSINKNYQRAKIVPSKIISKTCFFVGLDFICMLLGVFASQLVFLTFTYTQDNNLHLTAGSFAVAVIGINFCRKPFLDFLACRIT